MRRCGSRWPPEIADAVLREVRGHGPQLDDQTLLLVRVLQ